MQTKTPARVVVVGVNGGPTGRGALRWALVYAAQTGARIHAVRAWHVPLDEQVVAELPDLDVVPSIFPPSVPLRSEEHVLQDEALTHADLLAEAVDARYEREALQDLQSAVAGARAATGTADVEVEIDVQHGHPEQILCEAAEGAELMVLGRRERTPVGELLLGSVSHHCAREAPCPVVIVPAHVAEAQHPHPPRPARTPATAA